MCNTTSDAVCTKLTKQCLGTYF